MHDATLSMLASEVRGKTLRRLEGLTDEQARFTGLPSLNNSILWHAGHALIIVENLAVVPATGEAPAYPSNWHELFCMGSKPSTGSAWPSLSDVKTQLQLQLQRLLAFLKDVRSERLDQVIDAERNRSLRFAILHALHDEACHSGEIHLLRKMADQKK